MAYVHPSLTDLVLRALDLRLPPIDSRSPLFELGSSIFKLENSTFKLGTSSLELVLPISDTRGYGSALGQPPAVAGESSSLSRESGRIGGPRS